MGRFKSFFTGTRPSKSRENVSELRKQSSDIKIRARALKKLSNEERTMAKEFFQSQFYTIVFSRSFINQKSFIRHVKICSNIEGGEGTGKVVHARIEDILVIGF